MRPQQKLNQYHPARQAGVTTILAVLMMLSLFTFVAVVADTGRLYLEKRTLQKNADLAAMETALIYCRDQTLDVESMTLADMYVLSATRNDFKGNNTNSSLAVSRDGNAITVNLAYKVPTSLFAQLMPTGDNEINLSATATAKACEPTAQLTIRNSLVSVDGGMLNSVLGGLTGSTLTLSAAGWQGLIDADINLLNYLIELGATAGDYNSILSTNINLPTLLSIAADVLNTEGSTASITAANSLDSLALEIPTLPITLGDLINVQAEASKASLNTNINAFDLVQGLMQIAAGDSAISLDQTVSVLGLVNGKIGVKIISPPQISAIGNPESDTISVKTAQVRVFISLTTTLPLGLSNLIPAQIDVLVDAAEADATVDDYVCAADNEKQLNSLANTSAVSVKVGSFGSTPSNAYANVFSGSPILSPTAIIRIPAILLTPEIQILFKATMDLASNFNNLIIHTNDTDEELPEVAVMLTDNAFQPTTGVSSALALTPAVSFTPVIPLVTSLVSATVSTLTSSLSTVLSTLLTPIINPLLNTLGVSIAGAEVGAALTCENDTVRLVN